MPASRTRRNKTRSSRNLSKRRDKAAETRARTTQVAQQQAEKHKKTMTLAAYRRRRVIGWTLVALGVVVGVQHLLHHMGFWTLVSPGVDDLIAGYPLAAILGVGGAILLSKT
jgi:hypothetical protein